MDIDNIKARWQGLREGVRAPFSFAQAIDDFHSLLAIIRRQQDQIARLERDNENLRMLAKNNGDEMMREISTIVRKYS